MSDDPVADVMWMVRGAWVTMAIRAGCRLDVFDHLVEPRSADWLADATASDPGALTRLLRALAELGLLELRDDDPNVASWNHLDDAVRSGTGVYERVNGADPWEHLTAHPEQEAEFNRSMARRADGQVAAIVAGIDLASTETVVDVGGGRGAMLAGVLRAWPRLTGVVADRPDVAAEADAAFADAALSDRAHGVGTDFFESVPSGADVYFLSNVLHDWDDDDCLRILRTVRAAMDADSRLVLVERLLGVPGRSAAEVRDLTFVDLHMLVMFGARERTKAEYDALLVEAGFRRGELIVPELSWNLIETQPAVPTE
jgi:DNA-binding transcriptional ArsR family regulator